MAGRKSTLNKDLVIELFKNGHTYRAIAEKLNSNEDAIRMLIKRNTSDEDFSINKVAKEEKKKQAAKERKIAKSDDVDFIVKYTNKLDPAALKEIKDASRYGINTNESISTSSFIKLFRHSYICNKKTGVLHFDENRGAITKDVPRSYGADIKNTYNCHCLALIPGGDDITKEFRIKAYDNFDAEVKARIRVSKLISSKFTIRFLTVSEVGEIDG